MRATISARASGGKLPQAAQKLSPFLVALRDAMGADVTVVLNPAAAVAQFPLKRFYRYAVTPALSFDPSTGAARSASGVVFRDLVTDTVPPKETLAAAMGPENT